MGLIYLVEAIYCRDAIFTFPVYVLKFKYMYHLVPYQRTLFLFLSMYITHLTNIGLQSNHRSILFHSLIPSSLTITFDQFN